MSFRSRHDPAEASSPILLKRESKSSPIVPSHLPSSTARRAPMVNFTAPSPKVGPGAGLTIEIPSLEHQTPIDSSMSSSSVTKATSLEGSSCSSSENVENPDGFSLSTLFAQKGTGGGFQSSRTDDPPSSRRMRHNVGSLTVLEDAIFSFGSLGGSQNHKTGGGTVMTASSNGFSYDNIPQNSSFRRLDMCCPWMTRLFLDPCAVCGRFTSDDEMVYRCERCNHLECSTCFALDPAKKQEVVMKRAAEVAALTAGDTTSSQDEDEEEPEEGLYVRRTSLMHLHHIKRFVWPRCRDVPISIIWNQEMYDGETVVLNDYIVERELSRGSFASVKMAKHRPTGEVVAVKILKKLQMSCSSSRLRSLSGSPLLGANNSIGDPAAGQIREELQREIAALRLVNHPYVTKLKELIFNNDEFAIYLVQEYSGNVVHELGRPALPIDLIRRYSFELASALLYLHSIFLYHCDVKPENLLASEQTGSLRLADFGCCNSRIKSNRFDGTPSFCCPEQYRSEEVAGEVLDSWGYALCLYQFAYGTLPFNSSLNFALLRERIGSTEPFPFPDYPHDPHLKDLLELMLHKDLKQRLLLRDIELHPFFKKLQRPFIVTAEDAARAVRSPDVSFVSSRRVSISALEVVGPAEKTPRHLSSQQLWQRTGADSSNASTPVGSSARLGVEASLGGSSGAGAGAGSIPGANASLSGNVRSQQRASSTVNTTTSTLGTISSPSSRRKDTRANSSSPPALFTAKESSTRMTDVVPSWRKAFSSSGD